MVQFLQVKLRSFEDCLFYLREEGVLLAVDGSFSELLDVVTMRFDLVSSEEDFVVVSRVEEVLEIVFVVFPLDVV